MINLDAVLDAARQELLTEPGVVDVQQSENMLRVTVQNSKVRDQLRKTFFHEEQNFEIGMEVKTVEEVEAFNKSKEEPVS